MTQVKRFQKFLGELEELIDQKDNPEEWYALLGRHVGEYSIHTAESPEEIPDNPDDPAMQDATENVAGFYQIGTIGWSQKAFDGDVEFVSEVGVSESQDTIDRRVNGLIIVHESALSDEALELAREDPPEGSQP